LSFLVSFFKRVNSWRDLFFLTVPFWTYHDNPVLPLQEPHFFCPFLPIDLDWVLIDLDWVLFFTLSL
jgi:hypothetical protein